MHKVNVEEFERLRLLASDAAAAFEASQKALEAANEARKLADREYWVKCKAMEDAEHALWEHVRGTYREPLPRDL